MVFVENVKVPYVVLNDNTVVFELFDCESYSADHVVPEGSPVSLKVVMQYE